jgi:8-oxo-dGTP pyrophosphatase MutT (NUDIX family)
VPSWHDLERALAGHTPARQAQPAPRAAVALVLRGGPGGIELLLIRRAESERDPWSGHLGFPGGRAEPEDASLEATAVRETLEETGLDLAAGGQLLGWLDEVRAMARGRPVDLVIAPLVFRLRSRLDGAPSHEVVGLHWLPLARLLDPAHRSQLERTYAGTTVSLPCLRLGDLVLWGLSYGMFENLRALLARGARASGH